MRVFVSSAKSQSNLRRSARNNIIKKEIPDYASYKAQIII